MNNFFNKLAEKIENLQIEKISATSFSISGIYHNTLFKTSAFITNKGELKLNINGKSFLLNNKPKNFISGESATCIEDQSVIKSPITGTVKDVLVLNNQSVSKNDLLIKIESMKMILNVVAQKDGLVKNLNIKQGDKVSFDDCLLEIS